MAFRFRLEIQSIVVAEFSEVSGIQTETEVEPYEEGGVNDFVHQLPKRTKYQNLVLKRGITDIEEMWKWRQEVVSGIFERKTVTVILLDEIGRDAWRWEFEAAFPVKWTGPDFKADNNAIAFETIELAHHGLRKIA
jgi:phage tail-like protein